MRVAQINNYSYNANMQKQSFKLCTVPIPVKINAFDWKVVSILV